MCIHIIYGNANIRIPVQLPNKKRSNNEETCVFKSQQTKKHVSLTINSTYVGRGK